MVFPFLVSQQLLLPPPGASVFLVLAVTGLGPQQNPSFSHATLLDAEGTSLQQVALTSSSPSTSAYSALELVGRVESVPRVSFCIRLTGRDDAGNKLERVSMETIQPTHIEIQVDTDKGLAAVMRPSGECR